MYPRTLRRVTEQKYTLLNDNNVSTPIQSRRDRQSRWRQRAFYSLVIAWNIGLIWGCVYGIHAFYLIKTGSSPSPALRSISCSCGSTLAEAKAMGCKFDTLSASWLPDHCRDDELTEEFNKAGPGPGGEWEYWADMEGTMRLTPEQVGEIAAKPVHEAFVWVSWGWHVSHCSYYWRKQFRMAEKGMRVEQRYAPESHVAHCQKAFLVRDPLEDVGTRAQVYLGGDNEVAAKPQHDHHHHHQDHEEESHEAHRAPEHGKI